MIEFIRRNLSETRIYFRYGSWKRVNRSEWCVVCVCVCWAEGIGESQLEMLVSMATAVRLGWQGRGDVCNLKTETTTTTEELLLL